MSKVSRVKISQISASAGINKLFWNFILRKAFVHLERPVSAETSSLGLQCPGRGQSTVYCLHVICKGWK